MSIFKVISAALYYLSEGATALFTPNHDQYPNIGVQPFSGDPYSEWISASDDPIKNL